MSARPRMTRWFSPPRLASIGVRVAISTVFGRFADRRPSMAAERPLDPQDIDPVYDYARQSLQDDFWFDFMADTGDGWDSTYAVARLLAAQHINPSGCNENLPRGRVLIMGGDEVYPTPSAEDYKQKLENPFFEAYRKNPWPDTEAPDLYAIPGNHDWYDGLSAFLNLFCWRQRDGVWSFARPGGPIGGRRTRQTRSYFALKLPQNWWLWALDIQLSDYIDQQQVNFFDHVARNWMGDNSNLIICTGQPDWAYVDTEDPERTFDHFSYMESLARKAKKGHRVRLVLTGDSHHYSRYTEGDRNYITAGGGGAFLHPTHQLKDRTFQWLWPPPDGPEVPPLAPGEVRQKNYTRSFSLARDPNGRAHVFPEQGTSRALAWRNLAFAFYNWDYAATLGIFSIIFAWLLHTNALIDGTTLARALTVPIDFGGELRAYFALALTSPWPSLLFLAVLAGYCYFADYKGYWRIVAGFVHTLAQGAVAVLLTVIAARLLPLGDNIWVLLAYIGVAGGLGAATVMGLYLLLSLNWFCVHWDEAFSALRIRHYKNFLRIRIRTDGGLTVYPIGLTYTPSDHGAELRNPQLSPHLIEAAVSIR